MAILCKRCDQFNIPVIEGSDILPTSKLPIPKFSYRIRLGFSCLTPLPAIWCNTRSIFTLINCQVLDFLLGAIPSLLLDRESPPTSYMTDAECVRVRATQKNLDTYYAAIILCQVQCMRICSHVYRVIDGDVLMFFSII